MKRVGHAGTLDPQATGLLVVAVGAATRFLQYLPLEPKEYYAQIQFGAETTTQDAEGEVVAQKPVPSDLPAQFETFRGELTGLISQLPPMYSAVKKAGKPLYEYARKGQEVERSPRNVYIEEVELLEAAESMLTIRMVCSGGTYVRTWAHDLGQKIGCGAHLAALQRSRVGRFCIEDSIPLDEIEPEDLIPLREALNPPTQLVELNAAQTKAIREGQMVGTGKHSHQGLVAVTDPDGNVIGMARGMGNALQPECVLPIEVQHRPL